MPVDLSKLSISELEKLKKGYTKLYKTKLIDEIKKLRKETEQVKPKPKEPKMKKPKTFEQYFQECIQNKRIPPDTPLYLRKALERAMREHTQGIVREKSAFEDFANKYIIDSEPGLLPLEFFRRQKEYLKEFLKNHKNTKVRFVLVCMMEKQEGNEKLLFKVQDKAYFHSNLHINLESTDEKDLLASVKHTILEKINIYQQNGSGWYFKEIVNLEIHTVDYRPMKGGSYIPLPDWIMRKKAIVSLRNKDNKCFIWSILRYLHPREKNDSRLTDLYQYEHELNSRGFTFPVKIRDISKFERLNPGLSGINVFSVNESKKFYPLRMALRDPHKTIDLFLYEEDEQHHYSLIKNFSRLFRSQITSRTNEPIHICKRCFTHFTKEDLLLKHTAYCSSNESAAVKMPPSKTILKFQNYNKQFPIPFVIYADFECFTKPMKSCCPNPENSYSYNYQKHEPSGFCFYIKGIVPGKTFKPILYTKKTPNDDVSFIFVSKLENVVHKIYQDFYFRPLPLRMTQEQRVSYSKSEKCHICNEELLPTDKVCDHCHFTGEYRGAAHRNCNLQCRKPMIIPVVFHNLQGYDAHLFIKQLSSLKGDLTCIPSTEEKYISFSKKIKVDEYQSRDGKNVSLNMELRFIDSYKFLQTSLANLVKNLHPDDFYNTKEIFRENVDLLTRKGVYPYDYVSSIEKLSETQLPPKEEFYSKLNDECISDDDYQHAINVWNTFKCKTIRDYHDLYLKSDVLLLADVFENFRKTCLHHYNLDPTHYYTSPALAWDACLKETGQELQLLHDYDMLMMFEKGIRGGISHISKRYGQANNKYMKDYDPDEPSTYIQYLDANNLYGWAMSQSLPTHGFKWMRDLTKDTVMDILEKSNHSMINPKNKKGYIFEVDLEYPP